MDPGALFARATAAHRTGRSSEAAALCDELLARQPGNVKALSLRAELAFAAGDKQLAVTLLEKASTRAGRDPEVWRNLGIARASTGDWKNAIAALERAHAGAPRDPGLRQTLVGAYVEHGNRALASGDTDAAVAAYERAASIDATVPGVLLNLGNALYQGSRLEEAIAAFQRIEARDPSFSESRISLAGALIEVERLDDAIAICAEALAKSPSDAGLWRNLGVAQAKLGRTADAIVAYEKALALAPTAKETRLNLGKTYEQAGTVDDALREYTAALTLDPGYEAAHDVTGKALLLAGRLKEGWAEYRHRPSMVGEKSRGFHREPLARDLSGRDLHLRRDQGLGDEIFFLRFVPLLAERGAHIHYQAGPKIASLVARLDCLASVFTDDPPSVACEAKLSAGDLPYLLSLGDSDYVPSISIAVTTAAANEAKALLAATGPPPYIGLTWRGGTRERLALYKEITLDQLGTSVASLGATVLVLQRGPQPDEVGRLEAVIGRKVADLSALNDDLETMLAVLDRIEEYVGVSNTNVHLRAARGRTSRVLIPAPEFRWMIAGDESPWFPGTRLYRRGAGNDWTAALSALGRDLASSIGGSRQGHQGRPS